jgi:hypothetical protein
VAVTITGGTVTHVAVGGTDQFTATGVTAVVPPAGTIAITWSVVPTSWAWTPLVAGGALSSGLTASAPYYVPVMPGGTIIVTYTGSPAWAWVNYPQLGSETNSAGTPYAPSDTITGYSALSALPYATHTEGGLAGLGAGVSN